MVAAGPGQDRVTHRRAGLGRDSAAGTVTLAGVAWATHRGVDAVEVRIDSQPWAEATLAVSDTPDTWRHGVYVAERAAGQAHGRGARDRRDGHGTDFSRAGVVPDGATGYHPITVTVV